MAAFSLYACSSALHRLPSFPLHSFSSSTDVGISADDKLKTRFVVLSAHSNPRLLKFSNKSRFRRTISPYDIYDEEEDEEEFDDDDYPVATDDWLMNDDFAEVAEFDVNGKTYRSQKRNKKEGKFKQKEQYHASNRLKSSRVAFEDEDKLKATGGNSAVRKGSLVNPYHASSKVKEIGSLNLEGNRKVLPNTRPENKYQSLSDEIDFDRKWIPLLDYLSTFGLKESHFVQMYERHMPSLQISVCSAEERLEYLISVGVKHRDIKRILLRQPQILEYTVENNLKPHVAFLKGLGIPNSGMGQIIAAAPSLFSYSVENSLKPTVRYLIEEVGINENNLGKVVKLSPQILVQRIDISWNTRYLFLSKELGAPRDSVVKMVTKHPQLLHYSIDDGLLPRINFLRSIGMHDDDILKVLTSLTQVLSLSLEDNLKPKYEYLINELNNEVHSLTKYPMYLSLSLDQRIRPRHQFLVALKKAPKGPFPLSSFVPTDECFCQQWAGTSLDSYLAFRQRLLLKNFAKKYEKRGY